MLSKINNMLYAILGILFQLLYLSSSLVPILLMYVFYRLIPLLIRELSKSFNFHSVINAVKGTELSILIVVSCLLVSLWFIYSHYIVSKKQREQFEYNAVSSLNSDAMNLFLALALALGLITADKLNYEWLGTLFLFLTFLGWRINDYRVNLLLWFSGIKQFEISNGNGINHTLLTKKNLVNQRGSIQVVRLSDRLLMEV